MMRNDSVFVFKGRLDVRVIQGCKFLNISFFLSYFFLILALVCHSQSVVTNCKENVIVTMYDLRTKENGMRVGTSYILKGSEIH